MYRGNNKQDCQCNKAPHGMQGIVECILCKLAADRDKVRRAMEEANVRRAKELKTAHERLHKLREEVEIDRARSRQI